ncbi:MAG: hypothetical protein QME51_04590 [Planctomycetota bacterium]|nr:hypothetical protein [Planctomycetota bacterium]MDI6787629.1 hypothetical protein [Planctomycetota bacterium]
MEKVKKSPDEVNSFEFLSEHLYQQAKQGGFEAEFTQLKELLPYLNQFERLTDLLKLVEGKDEELVNYLLADLIRLYRIRKDLRPAIVIIIIHILWTDLTKLYEELPPRKCYDERFADIYWHLLLIMKDHQTKLNAKAIIISRLRSKFGV